MRGADEKGNVANYVETEQIAVFPVCALGRLSCSLLRRAATSPATCRFAAPFLFSGSRFGLCCASHSLLISPMQPATLKYTPKVLPASSSRLMCVLQVEFTGDDNAHFATASKHFQQQLTLYGEVVCVNLIDKKGDQEALGLLVFANIRTLVCRVAVSTDGRQVPQPSASLHLVPFRCCCQLIYSLHAQVRFPPRMPQNEVGKFGKAGMMSAASI